MTRKNIYDILNAQSFDPKKEFQKLKRLFEEENAEDCRYSFYRIVNDTLFRYFPDRGRYLSLDEMRQDISSYALLNHYKELDILFLYCEFVKFVIIQCLCVPDYVSYPLARRINILEQQMERILDVTGYEWLTREDGSWIVVKKKPAATEAAELVEDMNVSLKILEYNHFSLKGDIEGKKVILKSLYDIVEPIFSSKDWKDSGYSQLRSDTGFLFNNLNIRHNNLQGQNRKDYTANMSKEELELWYDRAYNCILAVIIMNEQIHTSSEIKKIGRLMANQ